MLIYIMITVLATPALAKGLKGCNLTNHNEDQHCFGALGESLFFYLPISTDDKTMLIRNGATVFKFANNTLLTVIDAYRNNCKYFTNGTLKVDKTTRNYSGVYQLEVYSLSSGRLLRKFRLNLHIQAQVSQSAVSQTCLSPQKMSVSCSAKGDDMDFTLSLDKNLLVQTKVEHGENQSVSDVIFTLHGRLEGDLVCNVQNKVSSEQAVIQLTSCKDTIGVTLAVTKSVIGVVLLPLALFLGFKAFNKKRNRVKLKEESTDVQ